MDGTGHASHVPGLPMLVALSSRFWLLIRALISEIPCCQGVSDWVFLGDGAKATH